jgi:hypothetical protein
MVRVGICGGRTVGEEATVEVAASVGARESIGCGVDAGAGGVPHPINTNALNTSQGLIGIT